ncbi:diguanylate cyclase domain-containing protein [Luteimicrobium sp. DT211]|uniref:sensor domain-containing diguanylate cyclase n=1 Tax=Luteimicrobium sp. DT211 TaxID=3393412 RepID=UPI003CEB181D
MHDEISRLARSVASPRATLAGVVGDLSQPVLVVGSTVPVGQLEVLFRRPEVSCVVVQDEADPRRTGMVTRAGLAAALTGRLGYGRAVLDRKPTASIADWSPLVVPPGLPVSEVALSAMARVDERRYDDVLVAGPTWSSATTADVMRSLVAALSDRSTHDPLTRLPTRAATWHALAHRCGLLRGSGTRVVLLLLDVRDMAGLNARHGQGGGDAVLAVLAGRLQAALPRGCEAGRVDGDRFAVLATLPAMDDITAAASADALRQHVLGELAVPPEDLEPGRWPALHSTVVWSVAGVGNPDELVREAERRLLQSAGGLARAS